MKELLLSEILENTQDLKKKKVGYVAVIGRPNVGKSTFLNTLIGEKVSITTPVPQTTRNKILAIYNDEKSQIVFIDTPGIHKSNQCFNAAINNQAISSLSDAQVVLYFIDTTREGGEEEKYIKTFLSGAKVPVLKVYTKIDTPAKIQVPEGGTTFPISSVTGEGIAPLISAITALLPVDFMLFPDDVYTKQDMRFRISEIIREQVFLSTHEELPHSAYVEVEEIEETPELLKIIAYVYTETDSQKYIIIGKGGKKVTHIGKEARLVLEEVFGEKVFLSLRVKVKKNWRKDDKFLQGYFKEALKN